MGDEMLPYYRRLTKAGDESLHGWGIDLAAIAASLLEQRWVRRLPNSRGVRPTDLGPACLSDALGISA